MDAPNPSANFFAPELFQSHLDALLPQDSLAPFSQDVDMTMEESGHIHDGQNLQVEDDLVKQEAVDNAYPPLDDEADDATMGLADSSLMDMVEDSLLADDASVGNSAEPNKKPRARKPGGRSRKQDPGAPPKSSIHSSKNEGQHTDRRYLCYICHKLFTRRRSVRDHISKIHNTKTWEPVRSLEVIVDPVSGEPIESIDEVVARGPPPPPPKLTKAEKAERDARRQEDAEELEEDEEDDGSEQKHHPDETLSVDQDHVPAQDPRPVERSTPPPTIAVSTLKKESSVAGSRASSTEPFATPAPVAGKKRPAPDDSAKSSSAAARKKGAAKIKSTPANKRAKLNTSERSSPAARSVYRSPSATPASMHLKPAPSKLKKQTSAASVSSPTPTSSRAASVEAESPASSTADTPGSSNDDGEVFCICRKGDNHTWMIACDGGCDEWFHGNCVNIRERDGELIDKYICPTCMKPGLQTTWKRMCRRKDCRKPARVMQDPPSKYCSDACGRMFFVELIQRGDPHAQTSRDGQYVVDADRPKKLRKKTKRPEGRRAKSPKPIGNPPVNGTIEDLVNAESRLATPAYSDDEKSEYETDSSLDDDMLPNRGAALRAGEVKALLERLQNVEQWKALGKKLDTPPREVDADTKAVPLAFDDLETTKMTTLEAEKRQLNQRNDLLTARESFLTLVKARSTTITEEVKKTHPKMKDICGFDPRIAWSEQEFQTWYSDKGGKQVIDAGPNGKIGPPDDDEHDDKKPNGVNGVNVNGVNGVGDSDDHEPETTDQMPKKGGVCVKNRCPRHRNWAKGQLAELRFEQDLVRRSLARCDAEENRIRERALVRAWENRAH